MNYIRSMKIMISLNPHGVSQTQKLQYPANSAILYFSMNVKIFKDLPQEANLVANDLIIMDINLAKKILNIDEENSTDIVLNVPNDLEKQNIKEQLILKHSNIRILQKESLKKEYENMFNYKGGIFLVLFIVVIFTFILILYQRYSMISLGDKKEIGILKAVGWSIKDILKLTQGLILISGPTGSGKTTTLY